MKEMIILTIACMCFAVGAYVQRGSGRLSLGVGPLHKNGLDVTLAYEHEMNYRHAWEFFVDGYLQWAECESCKHVCPKSFRRDYRTYSFGVVYRLCIMRGRNHHGSFRVGALGGGDTEKFLAGLHFGYEYNYVLRAG